MPGYAQMAAILKPDTAVITVMCCTTYGFPATVAQAVAVTLSYLDAWGIYLLGSFNVGCLVLLNERAAVNNVKAKAPKGQRQCC